MVISFVTFGDVAAPYPNASAMPPLAGWWSDDGGNAAAKADNRDHHGGAAGHMTKGVTTKYTTAAAPYNEFGREHRANLPERIYAMHFVRLQGLVERTEYSYRVVSGAPGAVWSEVRQFRSPYSSGVTKFALFGTRTSPY